MCLTLVVTAQGWEVTYHQKAPLYIIGLQKTYYDNGHGLHCKNESIRLQIFGENVGD